jgi:hypothetical protein
VVSKLIQRQDKSSYRLLTKVANDYYIINYISGGSWYRSIVCYNAK